MLPEATLVLVGLLPWRDRTKAQAARAGARAADEAQEVDDYRAAALAARPWRRLLLMIARPDLVFIRARKPMDRILLTLLRRLQ